MLITPILLDQLAARTAFVRPGPVPYDEARRIHLHHPPAEHPYLADRVVFATAEFIDVDIVLVDGRLTAGVAVPQRAIVKGDKRSMSIAAASIIAKVVRDQMMLEFDKKYPQYKFAKHKGYGTAEHMALMKTYGICPIHRRSFAPVKECFQQQLL